MGFESVVVGHATAAIWLEPYGLSPGPKEEVKEKGFNFRRQNRMGKFVTQSFDVGPCGIW